MLYHLLQKRRSIRHYKDQPIEKEKVKILMKSALRSPSSRGKRPWEFLVIEDSLMIEKLSYSKQHGSAFLKGAPLAIVVIADPSISDVWIEDTAIASTVIQLMAEHLGLGSCWVQIRERMHKENITSDAYVKSLLNIPKAYKVANIIGVGYADEEKSECKDDELLYNKVHSNTYP